MKMLRLLLGVCTWFSVQGMDELVPVTQPVMPDTRIVLHQASRGLQQGTIKTAQELFDALHAPLTPDGVSAVFYHAQQHNNPYIQNACRALVTAHPALHRTLEPRMHKDVAHAMLKKITYPDATTTMFRVDAESPVAHYDADDSLLVLSSEMGITGCDVPKATIKWHFDDFRVLPPRVTLTQLGEVFAHYFCFFRVINAQDGTCSADMAGSSEGYLTDMQVNSNGYCAIMAYSNNLVRIFCGQERRVEWYEDASVKSVSLSSDGKVAAVVTQNQILIRDIATQEIVAGGDHIGCITKAVISNKWVICYPGFGATVYDINNFENVLCAIDFGEQEPIKELSLNTEGNLALLSCKSGCYLYDLAAKRTLWYVPNRAARFFPGDDSKMIVLDGTSHLSIKKFVQGAGANALWGKRAVATNQELGKVASVQEVACLRKAAPDIQQVMIPNLIKIWQERARQHNQDDE